jgi:DNA replication licensing factor MCM7
MYSDQLISRHYIGLARQKRPTVPPQVSSYVVDSYVRLRKVSKDEEVQNKSHTYTSARTLLGVLRLAQALARLRFSDTVEHADVDEALRLMEVSKESLQEDADKEYEPDKSAVSQIFRLIKGMAVKGEDGASPRKTKRRRLGRGPGRERDMDVDSDDDDEEEESLEELAFIDIRARVLRAGFTEAQLNQTVTEVGFFPYSFSGKD